MAYMEYQIRKLPYGVQKKLADSLNIPNSPRNWKALISVMPNNMYTAMEVSSIEMEVMRMGGHPAMTLLIDLGRRGETVKQLAVWLKEIGNNEALEILEYDEEVQITEQPKSQRVHVGGSVNLRCKARGYPTPQYQWVKDGAALPDGVDEELTIDCVKMSDSGKYECIVSNRFNADKSNTVELQVLPSPGELAIVITSDGDITIGEKGSSGVSGDIKGDKQTEKQLHMHEEYREETSEETSTARNLRAEDLEKAAYAGPLLPTVVKGLSESERGVLRKHRIYISDSMEAEEPVQVLFSQGLLDQEDKEKILAKPTTKSKVYELLDILLRKGPKAFSCFLQALRASGFEFLARYLQSKLTGDLPASKVITSDGGVVVTDDVKLVFPPGAVDNPISVDIALEDPAKYYGLIVQKDLENDVIFASPLIRLQPKRQAFKKHVMLISKLKIKKFLIEDIVILHGTENRDGKVTWHDVTHDSKIDDTNAEVIIELEHFSLVAMLLKLSWIRTKDILSRLNLLAFSYTMSVLLNKHSVPEELALLFVSQEVYNEQFYKEHEASALVQLKAEGFEELQVISVDGQGEMRIYNSESLHVSLCLGEDYNFADSQQGITDFAVRSDVWWNAGEVIKIPLEWTKDERILCGTISVQGEYGHTSERHFNEKDLCGYVRKILGVEGAIFNLMPFVPDKIKSRVLKSWKGEDEQLEIVLQYWKDENNGDLAALKKDIENLKQGSPSYRVSQRGQMHVRNVRELATKMSGFQCTNGDLTKYSARRIQTLVKTVLRDCCIELEDSAEGIDRAAASTNHFDYLKIRRPIPEEIGGKYQVICWTLSGECIIKAFPTIVPHLIQQIKEIFLEEISRGQNGLRGLDEKKLQRALSNIRNASETISFRDLVDEVCEILHQLCMKNRHVDPTAEIETWAEHLAILSMLNFLKRFFQHCKQDLRLHKRLLQFSGRLRAINSNRIDIDEPLMRDFSDISQSLIVFAKFDPSKLVRFELTGSKKSLVSCHRECVSYDDHHDVFSQCFHIEKESEETLQLQATALVHIDGKIRKKGTFQSKIMLKASCKEAFERCLTHFTDVAATKLKDKDLENLRVVLCSAQREKLLEVLAMLKQKLRQEMIDMRGSEVTQCPLTIRTATSMAAAVVSLRLVYKWGSESLGFESKDFVVFAGIHDVDVVTLEENLLAHHEKPSTRGTRKQQQQIESEVATLHAVRKQQSQLPKEPPVCEEKQQGNGMQIAINITTSGKTITLDVDSSNSVEDVKKKIHRLEEYPPDQQRLVYLYKKLEDDHTLRDYDIPNGSTLNLVLSPWKVIHRQKGAC